MVFSLPEALRHRLTHLTVALFALAAWLLPLSPALAASPPADASPAWEALGQELQILQGQSGLYSVQQARRLADLSRLESAITDRRDRPTIANDSSHSLGVFVREKGQAADQPAAFAILAAGHQTDDDVETVALYLPANGPVSWPGRLQETTATPARVARLLPGEELRVTDGENGKGYQLSLPAFALETESADLAALPSLNQEQLDTQPETAPVD